MESVQVSKIEVDLTPSPAEEYSPWSGPARVEVAASIQDDFGDHELLSESTSPYTATTVQRALSAWIRLKNTSSFKMFCDYYHRLEQIEPKMPAKPILMARNEEFKLLNQVPECSAYFSENWGHIYRKHEVRWSAMTAGSSDVSPSQSSELPVYQYTSSSELSSASSSPRHSN